MQRWTRRWRWPARLAAVGGSALVLWLVLRRVDDVALADAFRSVRWGWYLAAQGVFGLGLLASALRWHLMLRLNHEAVVHGAASVRMVFISQFFNTVFGGPAGGDLPKTAIYSRWYGVPASDVLAASVLDRMVSGVGGLIFAVGALGLGVASGAFEFLDRLQWGTPRPWMWGAVAVGMGVILSLIVWGIARPDTFVGRLIEALRFSIRRLVGSARRSTHALLCAVLASILFNVIQVFCLQAVSSSPVPWPRLFWLYQVVTGVAALPVTVAGTGLREGTAMVLLRHYDIPGATAVAGAMLTLSVHLSWALLGALLLARETRIRRRPREVTVPRTISVVIPTLNEASELTETVRRLWAIKEVAEVVVSDGGSHDGTVEMASRLGCRCVAGGRGRGIQLQEGAREAVGDVVLFVHADTWLPSDAGAALLRCLRDPLVVGGGFWKRFRDPPWLMWGARFRCWLRLWWAGRVLGDQALFVRREALEGIGGVPTQALMEEVELCRRLRRVGRLALAGSVVIASERRFLQRGVLKTYWRMWRVSRGYRRGVPPETLVRWYEDV